MNDPAPRNHDPNYLNRVVGVSRFLYSHPLIRYIIVGGSSFLIYFVIIVVLHGQQNIKLTVATTIAYWTSVIWNFSLNRWWTFSAAETKSLHKHAAAYLLLLGFNYGFNLIFINTVSGFINYRVAAIAAVGIQTSWTYYTYKNIIFNGSSDKSED